MKSVVIRRYKSHEDRNNMVITNSELVTTVTTCNELRSAIANFIHPYFYGYYDQDGCDLGYYEDTWQHLGGRVVYKPGHFGRGIGSKYFGEHGTTEYFM